MDDNREADIPAVAIPAVDIPVDAQREVFAMDGGRPTVASALRKVASHRAAFGRVAFGPVVFRQAAFGRGRCHRVRREVGWGGHQPLVGLPATAMVLRQRPVDWPVGFSARNRPQLPHWVALPARCLDDLILENR